MPPAPRIFRGRGGGGGKYLELYPRSGVRVCLKESMVCIPKIDESSGIRVFFKEAMD